MPRTHAYGLIALFALVSKLLAPILSPLADEFRAIDRPRPCTPPQPRPRPVPPVVRPAAESTGIPAEPATVIADVPAVADTLPVNVVVTFSPVAVDFTVSTLAGIPVDSPAVRGSVIGIPTTGGADGSVQLPADPTSEAGIPATTTTGPGPLFVRKKTGGQWRYHVAQADAPGQKFRRLASGKRVRYEPAADPITQENDRDRTDRPDRRFDEPAAADDAERNRVRQPDHAGLVRGTGVGRTAGVQPARRRAVRSR